MLKSTMTAIAMLCATHAACQAEVSGAGHTVAAQRDKSAGYRVTLDGQSLYETSNADLVDVVGVYGNKSHAFALIVENSGGTGCPAMFRAVDITTPPLVSKPFGTCSDTPKDVHVEAGHLNVTLPRMDGQGVNVYVYGAGHLTKVTRSDVPRPMAPAPVHADDLAALVKGRFLADAVQVGAVAQAVFNTMGAQAFTASRKRILGGVGGPFQDRNDIVFASACVPQACGDSETAWAFDHAGHAWASWTERGRTTFFGDPPSAVRRLLAPHDH